MRLSVIQQSERASASSESDPIPVYSGELWRDCFQSIASMAHAERIIGGLSNPSKMPSFGYSIPASACRRGSKLASIEGSICFGCYAADSVKWWTQSGRNAYLGRYKNEPVKLCLARRLVSLADPLWVPAIVYLLSRKRSRRDDGTWRALTHFRWHDSGDLQSVGHMRNIVLIALALPSVKFWLPTRERGILRRYLAMYGQWPANLLVRVSADMLDQAAPDGWEHTSTVDDGNYIYGENDIACGAYKRGGECGGCRACWSSVVNIVYPKH